MVPQWSAAQSQFGLLDPSCPSLGSKHVTKMPPRKQADHPPMGRIGDRPYWLLNFSLVIRAAHQIGAAIFLAAFLLDAIPGPPRFYVMLAGASGALLMASEWLRHRQIFRETAGVVTLVKLLLLGLAYHAYLPAAVTVLLAFTLASIAAHAPKNIRHRLLY